MTTPLHKERLRAVRRVVRSSGAQSVADLGCGDGDLLVRLLDEPQIVRLLGIEISPDSLQRLRSRLGADLSRVELRQGSMLEVPATLSGFDCAVLLETIEHVDPRHLSVLEQSLFARMRPATVVITTPNVEYNPLLGLAPNEFRHPGHRFEWGRAKFRGWAQGVSRRNDYRLRCADLGDWDPEYGGASQMAVFELS